MIIWIHFQCSWAPECTGPKTRREEKPTLCSCFISSLCQQWAVRIAPTVHHHSQANESCIFYTENRCSRLHTDLLARAHGRNNNNNIIVLGKSTGSLARVSSQQSKSNTVDHMASVIPRVHAQSKCTASWQKQCKRRFCVRPLFPFFWRIVSEFFSLRQWQQIRMNMKNHILRFFAFFRDKKAKQ